MWRRRRCWRGWACMAARRGRWGEPLWRRCFCGPCCSWHHSARTPSSIKLHSPSHSTPAAATSPSSSPLPSWGRRGSPVWWYGTAVLSSPSSWNMPWTPTTLCSVALMRWSSAPAVVLSGILFFSSLNTLIHLLKP